MAIDANEIKQTIEMLDKADATNWNADGTPNLEVVRRLMGNDDVTVAQITAALAVPGDGTGIAPPKDGAMHSVTEANEEDSTGDGAVPDQLAIMKETAAKAAAEREAAQKKIDERKRAAAALAEEIAEGEKAIGKLDRVIEENTEQVSAAEMVKRIQKQTFDRNAKLAADQAKIREIAPSLAGRQHPSILDAALSAGARRSKVLIGGKVFEAPHPRSPEGVKAYGNWVHGGQKRPA